MFYIQSKHGEVLLKPVEYSHNLKNFNLIDQIIDERGVKSDITVFLESTSSYHYPIERFFVTKEYKVHTVNPNIVKISKTDLRKTKTDALDCVLMAACYFKEKFKSNSVKTSDIYDSLKTLNRQYLAYEKTITSLKNRYVRLLDICIPCHDVLMYSPNGKPNKAKRYTAKFMNFFSQYPHLDMIINTRIDKLANVLNETLELNLKKRLTQEAIVIKAVCKESYAGVESTHTEVDNLRQVIDTLTNLMKTQGEIASNIIELSKKTKYFTNINSINGIGELTTGQIIAELGDINRFKSYKEITAYLGLDPILRQSGKSVYYGPISKVGNRNGRKVIYTVIKNIVRTSSTKDTNNPIYVYYHKRLAEKKPKKYATVACSTKLIRLIFCLCKNDTFYISQTFTT